MKRFVACLLFLTTISASARAGCPALPPELKDIQVESCRFYDAAADDAFRAKVVEYFYEGWDNKSAEDVAQRRAATLDRNTGAIIDDGTAQYFFRTDDAQACADFPAGETVSLAVHKTCPMILFEAPVRLVVTWPDETDMWRLPSAEDVLDTQP